VVSVAREKTHRGELVESPEKFVEQPHQFLRRALRGEHREADDVREQNAETMQTNAQSAHATVNEDRARESRQANTSSAKSFFEALEKSHPHSWVSECDGGGERKTANGAATLGNGHRGGGKSWPEKCAKTRATPPHLKNLKWAKRVILLGWNGVVRMKTAFGWVVFNNEWT
jgi:hypothetical protein